MRKAIYLGLVLTLALVAVSCGGSAGAGSTGGESAGLSEDYADALSVPAQLIAGSLRLEGSELAIDEELAAELLPLWQAYQSLGASDTTAEAELNALVNQIQEAMSSEQVESIAAMGLTSEDVTALMQEQGIGLARGGAGAQGEEGNNPTGPGFGDGFPGGGRPDGGFPGGGPGGGLGQLSPEERATAVAERTGSSEAGDLATRGLLNALIRSLRVKTGEIDEADLPEMPAPRGRFRWLPIISDASGVALETLREGVAEGATLAEVIEAQGGDLAAAEAALQGALSSNPNLEEQDIEGQIDDLLHGTTSSE